jgi:hypothetical protein
MIFTCWSTIIAGVALDVIGNRIMQLSRYTNTVAFFPVAKKCDSSRLPNTPRVTPFTIGNRGGEKHILIGQKVFGDGKFEL